MPRIDRDKHGRPIGRLEAKDKRPKQRRELRAGFARLELHDDTGRVMSPTESLSILLADAGTDGIEESDFMALANQYADPNLLHRTAERLGAVRQRRPDGSIVVCIPPDEIEDKPDDTPPPQPDPATETESTSMAFADNSTGYPSIDPPAGNSKLVSVREAQQRIGAPIIGSGLRVIKDPAGGRGRFVYEAELDAHLAGTVSRGGKGAAQRAAEAVARGQKQRAAANRDGQHNDANPERDSRSRRYRKASIVNEREI